MAEINSLKGAQSAPPDLSTLEEIYSCTKSGKVYNLKGSRQIGCFKAPATFSSGDSFTVNGSPATAYMGSDILDELSKDRWYRFILDKDSSGRPVLNFKSGRIKVEYTVNHSKMNTDGSSYTLDATEKYIGIKGKPASAPLNYYNGFTSPPQESVNKLQRGWIVNYKYTRNKYTVTCIDVCDGKELGRSSWQQYYGTTASGAHQGTNPSTDVYYSDYGFISNTSTTVTEHGAIVYRNFEKRVFYFGSLNTSYDNANGPIGVEQGGNTVSSNSFSYKPGTTISMNISVSQQVTSIEEYGQVGKATAWISGTNASATAEGKTNNPSYTQASTNSLSYTFNSSGTAAVYLSVSAMRENAANSSSGIVYGEVSNIVIRNP